MLLESKPDPGSSGQFSTPSTPSLPEHGSLRYFRRQFGKAVNQCRRTTSYWRPIAIILLQFVLATGVALLAHWTVHLLPTVTWITYLLAIIFIGTRFRALGNILHECSHHTYMPTKRSNRLVGQLLALVDLTSFEVYCASHKSHHRHLGDECLDLDFKERQALGFAKLSPHPFIDHVVRPLLLLHIPFIFRPIFYSRLDSRAIKLARAIYPLILMMVAWAIGTMHFLLFVVLPYLTTYQMLRYWSDAFDHAGILKEMDTFRRTRNHLLPGNVLGWLFLPRNDGYHLLHHMFPALPSQYFPQVHRMLLADGWYAAREHRLTLAALGRREQLTLPPDVTARS